MRQSHLFTKPRKEAPHDEVARNAELLIRGGFIHKEMAGVYSYLPLGLRVLNNICNIIREEMNAIGGEEVFLSSLQDKSAWEKTGRWSEKEVDIWFKTALQGGGELGLAFTHEEPLTALLTGHISSYRDLPRFIYQIQTKFRNEIRAKSGIIRTREFLMKDLYSFSRSKEEHDVFYEKAKMAYTKVFSRVGLGEKTHLTFASGGSFSKYSHEFQTECDAGEDIVYVDQKKGIAVNREVLNNEVLSELGLSKKDLVEKKTVEVGNIFELGTRFSSALGLSLKSAEGEMFPVIMGSYGIGPARVMGVVAEILSDVKGLVWPTSIAPFHIHLIMLAKSEKAETLAQKVLSIADKQGVQVLYDDRDLSAGEKFAESDLIGIPYRFVISEKTIAQEKIEVKERITGTVSMIDSSLKSVEDYCARIAVSV